MALEKTPSFSLFSNDAQPSSSLNSCLRSVGEGTSCFAMAADDGTYRVFDIQEAAGAEVVEDSKWGTLPIVWLQIFSANDPVHSQAWTPDGKILVTLRHRQIRVYRARDGRGGVLLRKWPLTVETR